MMSTVFTGTIVSIDIINSSNTNTITLISTSSSLGVGGFFKKLVGNDILSINGKNLEKIALLSSDFKGLFNVYGDDQVNARKLLNPATIENILKLASHENLYELTIDQNHMIAACVILRALINLLYNAYKTISKITTTVTGQLLMSAVIGSINSPYI